MTHPWPLFDLAIETPLVSLRLPTDPELIALAAVAAAGVHRADERPFLHPWTEGGAEARARYVMQSHWRWLGRWTPEAWSLGLAVFVDDEAVGAVSLHADDFLVVREVSTSSWLGLAHHRRGFGTHARAGLLALAFDYLDASAALSNVFQDNHASRGVSQKLGYELDGISRDRRGDKVVTTDRLRLTRERWQSQLSHPVTIRGFEPCRDLFGL